MKISIFQKIATISLLIGLTIPENIFGQNKSIDSAFGYYKYYMSLKDTFTSDTFGMINLSNYLTNESNNTTIYNNVQIVNKTAPWYSKIALLKSAITIYSSNKKLDTLFNEIKYPTKINFIESVLNPNPILSYSSNDFNLASANNLVAPYINVEKAWDLCKGDPRIIIGINERGNININHEDLINNIDLTNTQLPSVFRDFHATAVAGCAGAVTDNNKGVNSSGFKNRIVFNNTLLNLVAVPGIRVINCSWFLGDQYSQVEEAFYNGFLIDRNIVLVFGAGNGMQHPTFPTNPITLLYPASYSEVLSVTSINHINEPGYICSYGAPPNQHCLIKDHFEVYDGLTNGLHQFNAAVDLCAPGHSVLTTSWLGQSANNEYAAADGTSFAAPIVASACGLIAAFNPCLTAIQIRDIIRESANPIIYSIAQNNNYIGGLGTGKLDVFAAINLAIARSTTFQQNVTYTSSQTINGFNLKVGNNVTTGAQGDVIVPNGMNIIYDIIHGAEFTGGFEVQSGGSFEVRNHESPCY